MTLMAEGVTVRFGGILALDAVSIEVQPGQVASVVGSNGSGKSTLFNAIMGFAGLASGAIRLDGRAIHELPAHRRVQLGLCRTFQTPRIDPESTVFDAIRSGGIMSLKSGLFAACLATPRGRSEAAGIDHRTEKVLEELRLAHLALARMGELPVGTIRLIDVGRAVMGKPRFILLDEPAAGLSHAEQDALKAQIRRLASEGVGVLLVEHNFRFVSDVSDHLTVLDRGRVLGSGRPGEVSKRPEFVRSYLGSFAGKASAAASPRAADTAAKAPAVMPMPLMECRKVTARYGGIRVCFDIDLDVPQAGVVALLGANGAGKSSLLGAISGLVQSTGSITLDGQRIDGLPAHRRSECGICFVPEIRGNIFPAMSVAENLELAQRRLCAQALDRMKAELEQMFPRLSERRFSPACMLSGGEQQMLALAMALSLKPRILLLDEPTQGLAPAVYDTLEAVVRAIVGNGIGVVLAEQNAAFAARLANQVIIIADGRVSLRTGAEILGDRERLLRAYLGAEPQEAA
ncbi:MAG: ATP-binding cassette domain-containing protein [Hyphomicrobiaceae bacterium]|nr:MAG: ATP-binding cassette domain-containing protein [Hyphomicrobiaceae bacterium]